MKKQRGAKRDMSPGSDQLKPSLYGMVNDTFEYEEPEEKQRGQALQEILTVTSLDTETSLSGGHRTFAADRNAVSLVVANTEMTSDYHTYTNSTPTPLLICKFICKYPKLSFAITMGLHLAIFILTVILHFSGYSILPFRFDAIPMNLYNKDVYLYQTAWQNRDRSEMMYDRSMTGALRERSLRHPGVSVTFLYEDIGGNVFSKENLRTIKNFEDDIYNDHQYKAHCVVKKNGGCEKPFSVMRFFDGTYGGILNDTRFLNISQTLSIANDNPMTKRELDFFLANDSLIDDAQPTSVSKITRSVFHFGYPLSGYSSIKDPDGMQKKRIEEFIVNKYAKALMNLSETGLNGLVFMYGNDALYWHAMNEQSYTDMKFVGGSFAFIFLFMWFQTTSIWLTVWGTIGILFSFVTGNFIYNLIFGFKYLGIFHVLALFIILGVGADDVFIFCDTWKSMKHTSYPSLSHRLSDTYRRAAGTTFVTSLTTAAAFLTGAFSPILAISSFGAFSGITILVNYFSTIIFYPCVIVLWHVHSTCGLPSCVRKLPTSITTMRSKSDVCPDIIRATVKSETILRSRYSVTPDRKYDQPVQSTRPLVMFISGPYYKIITKTTVRAVLLLIFVALISVCVYYVTCLVPDNKQPRVMKSWHNMERYQDRVLSAFKPIVDEHNVKLYIVWGIKSQDISSCNPREFDINCVGKVIWDDAFDLNPPRAQMALMEFCRKLINMTEAETTEYQIKRDVVTNIPDVKCFLLPMSRFLDEMSSASYLNGTRVYADAVNLRLPVNELKMRTFMRAHPQLYNMSQIPDTFYRYFETAYAYWISQGYRSTRDDNNADIYRTLIGETLDEHDSHDIRGRAGLKYGTRLKYVSVAVNLTLKLAGASFRDSLALYDKWTQLVDDAKSKMPASLQSGFHVTALAWHWFHVQDVFVQQGVLTVSIGVLVAWVVLVISSGNIIVGTMATFIIAGISTCVISLIPMIGWKLGVLEAINMTLVVGLSVDYVVHLGVAYTYTALSDRKGRIHYALREIGLSVVSGAITTLGSGFFMMFAQIVFFMQFGIFIFATIGFSILFAMAFFLVILSFLGPEGSTGMTGPLVRKLFHKLRGIESDDSKCQQCAGRGYVKRATSVKHPSDGLTL